MKPSANGTIFIFLMPKLSIKSLPAQKIAKKQKIFKPIFGLPKKLAY